MMRHLAFMALIILGIFGPQSVKSGGQLQNCNTSPSKMDRENVVDESDTLSMSCNTDSKGIY